MEYRSFGKTVRFGLKQACNRLVIMEWLFFKVPFPSPAKDLDEGKTVGKEYLVPVGDMEMNQI